jgi:hypothetical protein
MWFKRRPKFTAAQRLQLDLLIQGELEYVNSDAPVCMFDTEQEAEALAAVIKANSKKDDEE